MGRNYNELTIFGPLKRTASHIRKILSVVLLMVFAITLAPFNVFHHHEEEVVKCTGNEQQCSHRYHIHSHVEKCLICTIHFEKTYDKVQIQNLSYSNHTTVLKPFALVSGGYTKLISQALRGPPTA